MLKKSLLQKITPLSLFSLLAAINLVSLSYLFFIYFYYSDKPVAIKEATDTKRVKLEEEDYSIHKFGVIHVEVDSPSVMQSNFDVNPESNIVVYLNKPVSIDTLWPNINVLSLNNGMHYKIDSYTIDDRDMEEEGADDLDTRGWKGIWRQKVSFFTRERFEDSTNYIVDILSGYYDEEMTEQAKQTIEFHFRTADVPGMLSSNVVDGKLENPGENPLKITFKSPMPQEFPDELISVDPPVGELNLFLHDKVLTIENDFVTGQEYTIIFDGELEDLYGRPLGEDIQLDFLVS